MGIQGSPNSPRNAFFPTGTPEELTVLGEDLSEVHSCAVPVSDGRGGTTLRGCPFAGKKSRCHAMFNGRNPRIGDFGPKTDTPGEVGQGPENVPFSLRTAEGDELESFMPCHRFLIAVYPRMLAARNPQNPSGEKIRILGKAGETKIVVTHSLPVAPGSTKDVRMMHDTQVITVPKHIRPKELDPRWKERMLRDAADDQEAAMGWTEDQDSDGVHIDVASDEPAGEQPAAVAEEAPIRRRGK